MSDNIQHIDVDSADFEDAPKALRDYAKKLQAQNKQLNTDLGQARNKLNSFALADVLSGKGFKNPKKVERDLLADGIDPLDSGAVEAWLGDNESDYAKGSATPPPENPVNQERAQQHAAIQGVVASGSGPEGGAWERAQAEIATLQMPTGQQVADIYRKHGV